MGRCHVVVLFTWSTKKILPWLSIRASQSETQLIMDAKEGEGESKRQQTINDIISYFQSFIDT